MSGERLLLLDSASLYFRAFYGVPDQRESPTEHPTNAVRGFIDMLATLINAHHPTELVACWDNDWRPQWRVDLIPSYKAHRVAGVSDAVPAGEEPDQEHPATGGLAEEVPDDLGPQVPLIVDALTAFGIARIGVDGYEADDVIGSLVARHKGRLPIDVVSGDRDMLQLVDDAAPVRVLYTGKGGVREPDIGTEAMLREKYAVAHGEGYLEMSILRGDTSDGLPGVKGIGDKTAAQLISEFGSLAAIRAAVDNGDARLKGARRTNLEAAADYLDVAPTVVRVAPDAPLPDTDLRLPTTVADTRLLSELASTYGLTSPINRLLSALGLG
ncbi:MAG TPA: 5'-3' exonuclease [Phycicoccus elongatus]|jgi:5'-3' exonuclease|uniref:5'-3' exonuclease n=1 Tax=Phycicoccus elongatus Lp2 TaxID=1193181 RepID=N0E3I5_9MICO|nr:MULTISPECIES: 5'-3' exonuclease [Phycicoccus]MBK8729833.1 5'-3' exonuclease [Tetrasphaera sp.]MCB1238301.1 5'-3' exonuclease [Tetrasphaera sp.]MCB9405546.1 5'-3' exonuclease [Tetrasphaera sp.]MCO5301710.1 5'-3' exonuclease [Phycicoccus sp.]CCH70351.1 5'-3' exonuclease [Phycicoccus elongatus Lp2]